MKNVDPSLSYENRDLLVNTEQQKLRNRDTEIS